MRICALGRSGGFPESMGGTSGYLLEVNDKCILIDCGSGILSKLFSLKNLNEIDAIFLTHLHFDHIADIPVLKYAVEINRNLGNHIKTIPIFTPSTPKDIKEKIIDADCFDVQTWPAEKYFELFDTKIQIELMNHPVEAYALSIEYKDKKFVYSSDTTPCKELEELIWGADLAIMDAGSSDTQEKEFRKHMTSTECADIANKNNVKKLYISHLSPCFEYEQPLADAKNIFPQTYIPELLKWIEI